MPRLIKALAVIVLLENDEENTENESVNNDETFKFDDGVKVGYDNTAMESSPVQINTLSVELVD